MSKNIIHLTRILLVLLVVGSQFSVLASPGMDDDMDDDIYSSQQNMMKKRSARLDDEKFEVFQKVHDILVSLPSPIVDNLKLRKRVPVVIKMHEALLKAFVKAVPNDVIKIDKNMALMLLPVLILIIAQFVYMLKYIPLALISSFVNIGSKKTTWSKNEFGDSFSFDQTDQLGQIKAVSSEIQNAKLLLTQSSKNQGSGGQGPSKSANDEMEQIKQTLQQQLQSVNQLVQSVQKEISEFEKKRAGETAQLQSLSTKIDFIFKTQQGNAQQTQEDFETIKEHMLSRTIKLQNGGNNKPSIAEMYKGKSAQHIVDQQDHLETEGATADQALQEGDVDYYYSLPPTQLQEGEEVEYYYDEEDEEEEDEVQL